MLSCPLWRHCNECQWSQCDSAVLFCWCPGSLQAGSHQPVSSHAPSIVFRTKIGNKVMYHAGHAHFMIWKCFPHYWPFVWGIHPQHHITSQSLNGLTHWGRHKMAAISQTTLSNAFFFNESCCVLLKISWKYVRKDPIVNNPALVQIMAWCQTSNKPLSEPMIASFGDVYMHLSAWMS